MSSGGGISNDSGGGVVGGDGFNVKGGVVGHNDASIGVSGSANLRRATFTVRTMSDESAMASSARILSHT